MVCNTIGLTTDSFETLYVHGGAEVPEVYGGINYAQPIFYSLKTLTGATSYSFIGYPEPLKSYEIGGNMVQSGTPTPTSPIYPQECGDRTENLVNFSDRTTSIAGVELNIEKQKVTFSGTSDSSSGRLIPVSNDIVLEPGTYSFFVSTTGYCPGGILQNKFDSSKYYFPSETITLESKETFFVSFNFVVGREYNGDSIVMLNAGSTALPYEPYGYKIPLNLNGATQNLYLAEPLRKIGDYADSISSDGTVTRRVKKLVFDGTENWQQAYNAPYMFSYLNISDVGVGAPIMSHFILGNIGSTTTEIGFMLASSTQLRIRPDLATISSVDSFKQWLSSQYTAGTPVTLWHVLNTPTTEQVTVPTLTPATGNNTLAIGTTLKPSSVSITGHIKPSS